MKLIEIENEILNQKEEKSKRQQLIDSSIQLGVNVSKVNGYVKDILYQEEEKVIKKMQIEKVKKELKETFKEMVYIANSINTSMEDILK